MAVDARIGERIRVYRRRRGLAQAVLAGLVGRSESWLSQVERGVRAVDSVSVLLGIAEILRVEPASLIGYQVTTPGFADRPPGLDDIRAAVRDYPHLTLPDPPRITTRDARPLVVEVHELYQAAEYARAITLLPGLITGIDTLVAHEPVNRDGLVVQASVYLATAKVATKAGDADLALLAADRAATAASRADEPALSAVAAYQIACAFLRNDEIDHAERIATTAAWRAARTDPAALSVAGALTLLGAAIAARRRDHRETRTRLAHAQVLAEKLGEDANHWWTAFGPTNVRVHQISTAVRLGDVTEAIAKAEPFDVSGLPSELRGRRAQVHIDTAWAYAQRGEYPSAVVNLLRAERVAPQVIGFNAVARDLVRLMLTRERRTATPGLRALAQRAGVLS